MDCVVRSCLHLRRAFSGYSLSSVMQNCVLLQHSRPTSCDFWKKCYDHVLTCLMILLFWFLWSDLHMFCASSAEMNFHEIDVHAFLMFLMLLLYVVPARNAVQSYVSICFACFLWGLCSSDGSYRFLCAAHCSSKLFTRALCNASHEPQPTRRAGATRNPRTTRRYDRRWSPWTTSSRGYLPYVLETLCS